MRCQVVENKEWLVYNVTYQTSVISAGYCHHSAVIWTLLKACPFYTDVNYFFEITKGLPLENKKMLILQQYVLTLAWVVGSLEQYLQILQHALTDLFHYLGQGRLANSL